MRADRADGNGDVSAAKSSVAASSVLDVGRPHEEQKRTSTASSVWQVRHFGMRLSVQDTGLMDRFAGMTHCR